MMKFTVAQFAIAYIAVVLGFDVLHQFDGVCWIPRALETHQEVEIEQKPAVRVASEIHHAIKVLV